METRTRVRQVIASLLRRRGDSSPFLDSDSLVSSGRLASIDVMEIILFLEAELRADFSRIDFDQANFNSVDSIVAILPFLQRPS